jgi:hypothetical protein
LGQGQALGVADDLTHTRMAEQVRVHGSWLTDAAIAGRPQSQHPDLRPLRRRI